MRFSIVALVLAGTVVATPRAQDSQAEATRRKTYDTILDLNVRDGFVYYRALKADRAKLDGYVNQLSTASTDKMSREERIAFWLNAYNAVVLKTVVDHYPIPKRSAEYPEHSIRQIPGAFERLQHRLAGRMLTLDQIEQTVLPEFKDPRVYLALGRGAVGSGRLRSEAFSGPEIEKQLNEVAQECNSRPECVHIDRDGNKVLVSAIFSWREKDFVPVFADKASPAFSNRSPVERAVLGFIQPKLLQTEKDFLEKNQFQVVYMPFDWKLNDLTGRGGR